MNKIDRLIDEELKHCPFCGVGQSQVEMDHDDNGFFMIRCGRCGSNSGISKDQKIVRKTWNSRPHENKVK